MYIQGLNEAIDLRRMRKNEKASTQRLCKKSDDAFCRDQQCYKIIKIVQSQLGKSENCIQNMKLQKNRMMIVDFEATSNTETSIKCIIF